MSPNDILWYNTSWFAAVIGAIFGGIISLSIFILTNYINKVHQKELDKRNLLILLTQSNAKLFSIIHIGSMNRSKIDYSDLRDELKNTSIIWLLPTNLRIPFQELYKIHALSPAEYDKNKHTIYENLVKIEKELYKYGVDLFGDK